MLRKGFSIGVLLFLALSLVACSDGGGKCDGAGMASCAGVCVDTNSDEDNCGTCGKQCPGAQQCVDGTCIAECKGTGIEVCGQDCVNTQTNLKHCGGCGRECLGGAFCSGGNCGCNSDLTYCGSACVNTKVDNDNCGGCLRKCTTPQRCYQNNCVTPYDESCDGVDNDFDGLIDEDQNGKALTRSCDNLCGPGTETCMSGKFSGCTAPAAQDEICDNKDNDCDGLTDDNVTTTYYKDVDGDKYGNPDPATSVQACTRPTGYVENNLDCNDNDPKINPSAPEAPAFCEGVDNNCNSIVDEGCNCTEGSQVCGTDEGECNKGSQRCLPTGWGPCEGLNYVPPTTEVCDGKDNDCDGRTDEELADDLYEINDTCAQARELPTILENFGSEAVKKVSLYHGALPSSDADWFKLAAVEGDHFECADWNNWGKPQCGFEFSATLTVPADAVHLNYVMCVHTGECGNFDYTFCTDNPDMVVYDPATATYRMLLSWDGTCLIDDSWDFLIEVKNKTGAANSCQTYEMEFELTYDGVIADECPVVLNAFAKP